MSYINREFIERLIDKVDVVEVISDFVELKKAGANYQGKSPFIEERTPSFIVSPVKQIFKDFSSGKGGNVISFLTDPKIKGFTYPEAIEYLAQKYNEEVQYDTSEWAKEKAIQAQKKDKEYRPVLKAVLEQYKKAYKALPENTPARIEVEQNRKYDQDTIIEWQIGFVPSARMNYDNLSATGNVEIAKELNLINDKGNEKYWNRIIYPIYDDKGLLVGLAGRTISQDNKGAKWINPNENILYKKEGVWYGLHTAKQAIVRDKRAWIVEGYNDVISLHKNGVDVAIASCGTSITSAQILSLRKFTEHVVFAFDGDKAGRAAMLKYIPKFIEKGFRCDVIVFPEGVDPDDYSRNYVPKMSADNQPISLKEHLTTLIKDGFNILLDEYVQGDDIEKAKGVRLLCELIAKIQDETYKEVYTLWLAKHSPQTKATLNKWIKAKEETFREVETSYEEYELPKDVKVPFKELEKTIKYYGMFMANNQIYIMKDVSDRKVFYSVSNFKIEILQHMRDEKIPMKLYRMKNIFNQEVIFDAPSELINTPQAFEKMVTDHGKYRWKGSRSDLETLKTYLFDQMGTGNKIEVLGWQAEGFWVWNNMVVFPNGTQMEIDANGLFSYDNIDYYVPSANQIYAKNRSKYQAQKKFFYTKSKTSFEVYSSMVKTTHREHGISGILFAIASIYQDIVEEELDSFPIFFLYGPASSGKDQLANAIQSFTGTPQTAINLEGGASTLKAYARELAQFSNGISQLSEYKRGDAKLDGSLKGFWDRRGYKRGNITSDVGVDTVPILSSVILTGNEYPDAEALITRVIWNEMTKNQFSEEENLNYEKLKDVINDGVSSIASDLIKYRDRFKKNFSENHRRYKTILQGFIPDAQSRILSNLAVLGSTYEILKDQITFPFSQDEMIQHFKNSAEKQVRVMATASISSKWWFCFIASLRGHKEDRLQVYRDLKIEGEKVFFNFTNVYNKIQRQWWIQYHESSPSKSTMMDALRKSPYYIEELKSERLSEGRSAIKTSVIVLNLSKMEEDISQDINNGVEFQLIEGSLFDKNPFDQNSSDPLQPPNENQIITGKKPELPF